MTTQTHEERKAIAHAVIDGAELQAHNHFGEFTDYRPASSYLVCILESRNVTWRIKPERKPNAVNVGYCCVDESGLPGLTTTRQYHDDTHKMTIQTDPNETPPKVVSITLEPLK